MRLLLLVGISSLFSGLSPVAAQVALWPVEGISICDGCAPHNPFITPDGSGGVFIAWVDERNHGVSQSDIYIQRITAAGTRAPGWPEGGVAVTNAARSQILTGLAPDDFGGALLVWQDLRNNETTIHDIYCQRILPDGSVAPGWIPGGTPACEWPQQQGNCSSIIADGSGGAYILWDDLRATGQEDDQDVYAQHLTADGQIAPGWIEGGLPISTAPVHQGIGPGPDNLVSDGAGGMIAVWDDCDFQTCESYALRLTSDGTPAPGWPPEGRSIFEIKGPRIVADGVGGYFVSANVGGGGGFLSHLFVKHIDSQGDFAAGWPDNGVQVCCSVGGRAGRPALAADGIGGVFLIRTDNTSTGRDVFAFRVAADGSLPPGWPFDGLRINDPAIATNSGRSPVSDGAGGMWTTWETEESVGKPVRVQHLSSAGVPAANWPDYGMRVTSTRGQFDPAITSDGAGGAIVVWEERGGIESRLGLFAQRFADEREVSTLLTLQSVGAEVGLVTLLWQAGETATGAAVQRRTWSSNWKQLGVPIADDPDLLRYEDRDVEPGARYAYRLSYLSEGVQQFTDEVWVEVPALKLALAGFQPNPARGRGVVAFTLPSADPADLEVVDLRGRRVWSREVGSMGPGSHTLQLGIELRPGVYWLRLRQGGATITTRGVVLF